MADLTAAEMTPDQLWALALQHLAELVHLLDPAYRHQPVQGLAYWTAVNMNVGALTTLLRELSQRDAPTH
jgi:hypothetical protein